MLHHQLLLSVLSLLLLYTYEVSCANQPARITCFFQTSAVHRQSLGHYDIEDIPAHLCTHIIYGFIGVNDTNWNVLILDPEYDVIKNGFNKFTQLRKKHPDLTLQIGVGGWFEGSKKYSQMVAVRERRQIFIRSLVNFTNYYEFDGLDLYWVFPGDTSVGGSGADKDNLLDFVQELRHAVDRENWGWEITMTAPVKENLINNGYNVIGLCELLDAVNTVAFNFHGPWEDFLDVHSPLYKRKHDKHPYEKSNVNDGLILWTEKGCPATKLVLGLNFASRTFILNKSITNHSIDKVRNKNLGFGPSGPYSNNWGFLAYYEICTEIMAPWKGLKVGWDDEGMVPYAYNDTAWVGYESERSVQIKMDFIKEKGYGGAMAFEMTSDDFHGLCGTKHILLKTIYDNMKNYNILNEMPNPTIIEQPATSPRPVPNTTIIEQPATSPRPVPHTTIIEQPATSPSPVVQVSDKTPTLEPESKPVTCTNGIVTPHTDRQKYIRCVDGKLMEFECKEGTEFNTLKKFCDRLENIESLISNGTNIYFVDHIYIENFYL